MDKKKVYVSSTFQDLADHRQAVKAALERAGYDVECMEKYPAFDQRPLDKCLADVADCDFYVLILGLRYGHQPKAGNPGKLSITHLEYEEAARLDKPCLVFLREPDDCPYTQADPDALGAKAKIGKFRKLVEARHGRRTFTSPDSLATAVLEALRSHEQKNLSATARGNAQIRERYLDWLRRTCQSVELLGLDLKDSQNVRLGQVYVPAVTPAWDKKAQQNRQDGLLLARLEQDSLYVPGNPGAGKSTFCRWLALVVAGGAIPAHPVDGPEEYQEKLPDSLRGRFPLLCALREWAVHEDLLHGKGEWTAALWEQSLGASLDKTKPGGLDAAAFFEELKAGRALLILDGVDEVPETLPGGHRPRQNLITGLADALPGWLQQGNRVLLTSRPYGLNDADRRRLNLPLAELAELPEALQHTFVRRWYAAADPPRAIEKAEGLLGHLAGREDLAELRRNPMLLTALCVMYDQGQRLPQDFYRLYDAVVSQVLYKRYATENERDAARRRLAAVALGMHQGADAQRASPAAQVDTEEVDCHLAEQGQTDRYTERGAADVVAKREDLYSNSGLLLPRAGGRAAFYHLSFQEFLAATRLHVLPGEASAVFARRAAVAEWRRTLLFLFCTVADKLSAEAGVDAIQPLLAHLQPAKLEQNPNPALLLADCLEVAHGRAWDLSPFAEPLRRACEHSLEHLKPEPRAHLWRALGRIGLDDRPGVGLKDGLPDIDWEEIPAGDFLYGEDQEKHWLPTYRIARYPVTNAQFQAFLDDQGYETDGWWQDLAQRPKPAPGRWPGPNLPRETVSWFEAVAFCRWLEARLRERGRLPDGMSLRLPTEAEWEKAARGVDGRAYPWGAAYTPGWANINETADKSGPHYLRQTSAVGIYPPGASPYGLLDMAGNVWEWCLDERDAPERQGQKGSAERVVRGGAWNVDLDLARCAVCVWFRPGFRVSNLGFRVVLRSSPASSTPPSANSAL